MKLALYGQWNEVSGLIYTFPEKLTSEKSSELPGWAQSLFDPRFVRGIFKGDYCYALWYNDNGYYYSCIKTNTDSRNGCVMLTLYAEKMVPLVGSRIAEKMRMLLDYCLSKSNYTEIAHVEVFNKAKEFEALLTHRALPKETDLTSDDKMAYRLYRNEEELGLIMENPNQLPYAGYKCVWVVEESAFVGDAVQSQSITQIIDPIKKTYDIRSDSKDVVASKESVMEGEMFSITYKKSGFADEYVEIAAGKSSGYYSIDGNVINLKSASEVGIHFKREIIIIVVDEETNATIEKWTCKIDSKLKSEDRIKNADNSVSIKVEPDRPYKIVISSDGYEDKLLELAANEHGLKKVKMHPLDDSVFVRLQMGGKEYSGDVRMKSNSKLYSRLKRLNETDEVLQVKRPFFSRRNMMPILVLFLSSLLLGGALGWFVFKDKKQEQPNSVSIDEYNKVNEQLNEKKQELNTVRQELDTIKKDNDNYMSLLPKYGEMLNLIKEKKNPEAVADVLSKDDYNALLKGNEKDLQVFNKLVGELQNIKKKKTDGGNGGENGGKGGGSSILIDLFKEDSWDLNAISNTGQNGKSFVDKIQNTKHNDLETLLTGNSAYKTARENNSTWCSILEKANELGNDLPKFFKYMNESPRMENNVLYLKEVDKYFKYE